MANFRCCLLIPRLNKEVINQCATSFFSSMLYSMCNKRVLKVIELNTYILRICICFYNHNKHEHNFSGFRIVRCLGTLIVNYENFNLFDKKEISFRDLWSILLQPKIASFDHSSDQKSDEDKIKIKSTSEYKF